jgi:DNA invertase Pin-like site-specific DNA recombinase
MEGTIAQGLAEMGVAAPIEQAAVQVTYCLYARKSTEDDERQALSIDSQIKEMLGVAKRDGLKVIDVRRESHSAKASGARPVYQQLLADVRSGIFNGILTWAPDRLSRNGGDLGAIVDLMDQKLLVEIRTYSQSFRNNPNEKFLLMILGSQAKLENDNKSLNVKRGLKARAEMGLWPGIAPTGYLNDKRSDHKCEILVDPVRSPIVKQIFEKIGRDRWSGRRVYMWLKNDLQFTTRRGKNLTLSTVYKMIKNPFYAGMYEFPHGSGNWYTGKHTSLINKELFQLTQEKIAEENRPKTKFHDFTFTKLMVCGLCDSGITAQEKLKNMSDGSVQGYLYYSCTKHKDKECKNPYIREDNLIAQLVEMIDELSIDEIGARHVIEREVTRYNKLRASMLGVKEKDKAKEIDIRKYAKYMLREGTLVERRELLQHLRNRIVMKDKKISLEN